jgi:hypothetical protein
MTWEVRFGPRIGYMARERHRVQGGFLVQDVPLARLGVDSGEGKGVGARRESRIALRHTNRAARAAGEQN